MEKEKETIILQQIPRCKEGSKYHKWSLQELKNGFNRECLVCPVRIRGEWK